MPYYEYHTTDNILNKKCQIFKSQIKDWNELEKISELPNLTNCVFFGNEFYDKYSKSEARLTVLKRLPRLTMIDNIMVSENDRKVLQPEEK